MKLDTVLRSLGGGAWVASLALVVYSCAGSTRPVVVPVTGQCDPTEVDVPSQLPAGCVKGRRIPINLKGKAQDDKGFDAVVWQCPADTRVPQTPASDVDLCECDDSCTTGISRKKTSCRDWIAFPSLASRCLQTQTPASHDLRAAGAADGGTTPGNVVYMALYGGQMPCGGGCGAPPGHQ
jgi:hypothetical protein